jgi:MoxR-like ATPase
VDWGSVESAAECAAHIASSLLVVPYSNALLKAPASTAGRHHMLFHGPPGVGKTMLAERVPGLAP